MTDSPNIPIERIEAEFNLTRRQVYRMTRLGCIPATFIGRTWRMTVGQYDDLCRNGFRPEPQRKKPAPKKQPTFLHTRKSA